MSVGNGQVASGRKRPQPPRSVGGRSVRRVTVEKVEVASTSATEDKRLMLMIEAVEYDDDDDNEDSEDEAHVCARFNV